MKRISTRKAKQTPQAVYKEICIRSGGKWIRGICSDGHCEYCQDRNRDWLGLCFSHTKHRKLGGTTSPEIHSAENIKRACWPCHEWLDGRRRHLDYISPALQEARERKLSHRGPVEEL